MNYADTNREKILSNTDIVSVVSEYVPLKHAGINYKANCPFHNEKTASFFVSPSKQIFHCFGCGAGGTAIEFFQRINGLNYFEAIKGLSEKYGIQITYNEKFESDDKNELYSINSSALEFYKNELKKNKAAYNYFNKRSLSDDTIVLFGLGYAPDSWTLLKQDLNRKGFKDEKIIEAGLLIKKENGDTYDRFRNRVMFPIFNLSNKPIAFGGRVINGDNEFKYINSPETPVYHKGGMLYGLNLSKKYIMEYDRAYILEGYMDLITCYQFGIKNVAATLGTALTPAQIKLLSRFTKNIVMIYDGDEAGISAMWRSIEKLLEQDIYPEIYIIEDDMDPAEILLLKGSEYFIKKISRPLSFFEFSLLKLSAENKPNSLIGKKNIIAGMINIFKHINDNVILSELIKKLSEKIEVDYNVLFSEVKKNIKLSKAKSERKFFENTSSESININLGDMFSAVEYKILKILLDNGNQEIIKKFQELIELENLDEPLNIVFGIIFETGNASPRFLLDYFSEQKDVQQLITRLSVGKPDSAGFPDYMEENIDSVIDDYINQYEKKKKQSDSNEIFQQLKNNNSLESGQEESDKAALLLQKQLELKRFKTVHKEKTSGVQV